MKLKLCVLTALSLAGLALSAAPASAWWLCHNCGCNRYSTVIVCRPYNAFTPVCSGSLVCDGCCPFSCPNLPAGAACSPVLGNPMLGLNQDVAGLNSVYQQPYQNVYQQPYQQPLLMQAPVMMQAPAGVMPPPQLPANLQTQAPMGYQVQPAGYQQGYYPMYYPMYPTQQAPAYWYGY